MAEQLDEVGRAQVPAPLGRLGAAEIVAYLRAHPDFLKDHEELLSVLTPPGPRTGDNVLDFQQFLVERLRAEVARLKLQQRRLISTTRLNLGSQQRVHAAALAIIGADDFPTLIQTVTTDLAVQLDIDTVTLCIEAAGVGSASSPGIVLVPLGLVDRLLPDGREAALRSNLTGDPAIHGGAAGLVRSEALLRLVIPSGPAGMLALGSRRASTFQPGHGSELLCFLSRTLGVTLAQWLDL